MLLRTFTPETLTGSQNFDTFHKPTNVELLANQLVLMETTVFTTTVIILVCINSIASTVTIIVLYYNNMVLLSRHPADTGLFFSIVWYSRSIISVLYSVKCRHFRLGIQMLRSSSYFFYSDRLKIS